VNRVMAHCPHARRVRTIKPHRLLIALFCAVSGTAQTPQAAPLKLVQTIRLQVSGRLNHMIVDRLNDRAFVTRNDTVEVVDLRTAQTVASITNPGRPGELIYFKKCDCIAYSTSSGALRILNPNTLTAEEEFALGGGAGSVALDPQHGLVYVAQSGAGVDKQHSRITFIDLMERKKSGQISVEGGKLGQVVLEHHGPRGYVNDTATNQVLVIDLNERRVVERWNLSVGVENVSLALDENNHRLLVGSRKPDTLIVIDTITGKAVAHLPSTSDVDDMAYDAKLRRIYMSGNDGFVDVFQQEGPNAYSHIARIPTGSGAGKSKWVPEQDRLYVEMSSRKPSEKAQVLVFESVE